jgi:hypothetical protein
LFEDRQIYETKKIWSLGNNNEFELGFSKSLKENFSFAIRQLSFHINISGILTFKSKKILKNRLLETRTKENMKNRIKMLYCVVIWDWHKYWYICNLEGNVLTSLAYSVWILYMHINLNFIQEQKNKEEDWRRSRGNLYSLKLKGKHEFSRRLMNEWEPEKKEGFSFYLQVFGSYFKR